VRRFHSRAFTLIELLVVVAVIAIIASVLSPTFVQAREKVRATRCVSNLRQLSVAIHEYMQDWDGWLPEFGDWGEASPEKYVSFRWYGHIMPYLKSREILHCPSDNVHNGLRAVTVRQLKWADLSSIPSLSYGYNWWLQQTRESVVALPSDTVLLGDAAFLQCRDAVVSMAPRSSCYAYPNTTKHIVAGIAGQERHGAGSNIAFCDGHVRFVPANQFRRRSQGRSCDEYPLVEPDCHLWE
jgi:prepilin-type N-terminal cleavage/methylation domain-containing protein/prepilin-type processing-associated H-X9-DG protein